MSAKWRMVLGFTLMMLLLAGVTLTFVLVMNGSVIANPTSQVFKEVSRPTILSSITARSTGTI